MGVENAGVGGRRGAGRELGIGEGREAVWTWRVGRAVVTMIFIII